MIFCVSMAESQPRISKWTMVDFTLPPLDPVAASLESHPVLNFEQTPEQPSSKQPQHHHQPGSIYPPPATRWPTFSPSHGTTSSPQSTPSSPSSRVTAALACAQTKNNIKRYGNSTNSAPFLSSFPTTWKAFDRTAINWTRRQLVSSCELICVPLRDGDVE
jgi:hypothetical protein